MLHWKLSGRLKRLSESIKDKIKFLCSFRQVKICPLAISDINSLILTVYLEDRFLEGATLVILPAFKMWTRKPAVLLGLVLTSPKSPTQVAHGTDRIQKLLQLPCTPVASMGSQRGRCAGLRLCGCHLLMFHEFSSKGPFCFALTASVASPTSHTSQEKRYWYGILAKMYLHHLDTDANNTIKSIFSVIFSTLVLLYLFRIKQCYVLRTLSKLYNQKLLPPQVYWCHMYFMFPWFENLI